MVANKERNFEIRYWTMHISIIIYSSSILITMKHNRQLFLQISDFATFYGLLHHYGELFCVYFYKFREKNKSLTEVTQIGSTVK